MVVVVVVTMKNIMSLKIFRMTNIHNTYNFLNMRLLKAMGSHREVPMSGHRDNYKACRDIR